MQSAVQRNPNLQVHGNVYAVQPIQASSVRSAVQKDLMTANGPVHAVRPIQANSVPTAVQKSLNKKRKACLLTL